MSSHLPWEQIQSETSSSHDAGIRTDNCSSPPLGVWALRRAPHVIQRRNLELLGSTAQTLLLSCPTRADRKAVPSVQCGHVSLGTPLGQFCLLITF